MAASGSHATDVADRINNRIAAIARIAESMKVEGRYAPGDETDIAPLELILEQAKRIATISRQIAEHTCAAYGVSCEFEFERNYPPTINSAHEAEFARQVMGGIVGEAQVLRQEPTMGAEDFAYMLQARPGAYCVIGNGDGVDSEKGHGGGPCMLHNPSYDFNDELIPLGATYWVKLAEAWLAPDD